MLRRHLLLRVAGPTMLVSLLLLGLCTATAVYLYRQQATTAHMLDAHIISRKIDHEFETAIADLIAVHRDGSDQVDALHERMRTLLTDIQALARPVLRHRLILNFYAESERVALDAIVERLLEAAPVPQSGL